MNRLALMLMKLVARHVITTKYYFLVKKFLTTLEIEKVEQSKLELTQKILFKTKDNHFIEAVSMVDENRHTVCISSQNRAAELQPIV